MALRVFTNAQGRLRSGWWLIIFLVVLVAFLAPLIVLAAAREQSVPIWQQACALFAASMTCQILRRRPMTEMLGAFDQRWLIGLGAGLGLGFAVMAAPAALLAAFGAVTFQINALNGAVLADLFGIFVAVAITEELMFRGFAFQRLLDGLGLWPAQMIGAFFFVLTHSDALREAGTLGVIGAINIFVASLMFGFAFVRTRSLALPIGIHLAANFTQGALLGFGVSGSDAQGWLSPVFRGPDWLTGGAFGLEASMPGLVCVIVLTVALMRWRGLSASAPAAAVS